MHYNYLAFSIPFFLLLIGWEFWYSKKHGKNFFQFAESVANLNVGIAERLLDVITVGLFYYYFDYLYTHFAFFHWKPGIISWIALFLATDFVWYWYHRKAHEVNIMWAVHVVHHQSDDFNYTVSARITVFQAVVRCLFWSVLPLAGFSASMITTLLLVHGLYPFFIHTQTIGRLGILEYFLVTPSHHRVHHSSNPEYLDKNYGDVLIIWDKLFGTFKKETVQPIFGLTKPLNSYSFLWQHFHFPLEMAVSLKNAKSWKQRWKVVFGRPDDLDPQVRVHLENKLLRHEHRFQPTKVLRTYIVCQTICSLALLFVVSFLEKMLTTPQLFIAMAFIIICLINTGAMLEQKYWIFYLEYVKLSLFLIGAGLFHLNVFFISTLILILVMLLLFIRPIKQLYMQAMFKPVSGTG